VVRLLVERPVVPSTVDFENEHPRSPKEVDVADPTLLVAEGDLPLRGW
jgi:hypothetical protein